MVGLLRSGDSNLCKISSLKHFLVICDAFISLLTYRQRVNSYEKIFLYRGNICKLYFKKNPFRFQCTMIFLLKRLSYLRKQKNLRNSLRGFVILHEISQVIRHFLEKFISLFTIVSQGFIFLF